MQRLTLDGHIRNYETVLLAKGNRWIDASASFALLRDPQGAIIGTLGVVRDVTEHKRLEAQFRQAQKMEAVGRLAGGIAHDFNNLLTVITGRSDLLLALGLDSSTRRHIQLIAETADRAAKLTHQLLAFSRKQLLQTRVLDLDSIVTGLAPILGRLIGEDIDLSISLGSGPSYVSADAGQIEQVLLNLAVNARDAMPRGGRLRIETAQVRLAQWSTFHDDQAPPGPYILLTVSDTGVGIDTQALPHLFEPFFTTKGPGQGTGLGLATVYGIVKQHGGYVSVDSQAGQGTTFKIHLPQVENPGQVDQAEASVSPAPRGSETVLVVEDEAQVRDFVRETLESFGYKVLEASRPQESLLIAEGHREPIHLLLTDVVMPEMHGPTLAERLVVIHPETKVLYMSGYTDEALGDHGVVDDVTAILLKPFTPHALAHSVRNALGG